MNDSPNEEKDQIFYLLLELHEASRRSIYEEMQYFIATENSMTEIKLGAKRFKSFSTSQDIQLRTWSTIIEDICEFVPFMTESEYLIASHLVSICLLSCVLPQKSKSTKIRCNNGPRIRSLNEIAEDLSALEDILESAAHGDGSMVTSSHQFIIQDELIQATMWDFIYRGLGKFLSCRTLSLVEMNVNPDNAKCTIISGSSDLLHALSMSICNDYSMNENDNVLSLSDRVVHMMNQSNRRSFQISQLIRGEIVHIISRTLSLPTLDITEKSVTESLIAGGVLHLRTALQNFCVMTLDPYQLLDARKALLTIAVDTELFIKAVIKSLIVDLMNDHSSQSSAPNCRSISRDTVKHRLNTNIYNRYVNCDVIHRKENFVLESQIKRQTMKREFCVACATGDLLLDMIARYSRSRFHADESCIQDILTEMVTVIKELNDQIKKHNSNQMTNKMIPRPCSIAALLDCARLLLYFSVNQNGSDSNLMENESHVFDSKSKVSLLEETVELIDCSEYCITKSASSLLALAFTYEDPSFCESFVRKIFIYLKKMFHQMKEYEIYYDLIGVLSRSNHRFACSIIKFSFDEILSSKSDQRFLLKIVNMVSSARPTALSQFLKMNSSSMDLASKISMRDLTYMYLSLKRSLTSDQDTNEWTDTVMRLTCTVSDLWSLYQVARYAFCTGNFNVAQDVVEKRLLSSSSTALSYSWLSILSSVALAEHLLQSNGSNGIVQALCYFNKSLIQLRSLESITNISTRFQIDIVSCRRDLLNLCLAVLNLSGEARLSHAAIRTNRRSCLHIRNLPRCFHALASRYHEIYKRNGLFCCETTRSYLRTQFRLCIFLAKSVQRAFISKSNVSKKAINENMTHGWPKGDKSSLLMELTSNLENNVLKHWDNHQVEPGVRVAKMSDIVDSIMKSVNPFPRGFLSFKDIPMTAVQVIMKQGTSISNEERVIPHEPMTFEVDTAKSYSFTFSGTIPSKLFKLSNQPFSQVMVLCNFSFDGPLQRDDAEDERDLEKVFPTHILEITTGESTLLPNAKFTIECACPYFSLEGYYQCDVKLQVRDIRCGEYTIPSSLDGNSIILMYKSSSL